MTQTMRMCTRAAALVASLAFSVPATAQHENSGLRPLDVFELEHAGDPQISPGGDQVVYVRSLWTS